MIFDDLCMYSSRSTFLDGFPSIFNTHPKHRTSHSRWSGPIICRGPLLGPNTAELCASCASAAPASWLGKCRRMSGASSFRAKVAPRLGYGGGSLRWWLYRDVERTQIYGCRRMLNPKLFEDGPCFQVSVFDGSEVPGRTLNNSR